MSKLTSEPIDFTTRQMDVILQCVADRASVTKSASEHAQLNRISAKIHGALRVVQRRHEERLGKS